MLYVFPKFNVIVYRQNNYWNIKFSAIFWNVVCVVSIAGSAVLGGLEAIAAALDLSSYAISLPFQSVLFNS